MSSGMGVVILVLTFLMKEGGAGDPRLAQET